MPGDWDKNVHPDLVEETPQTDAPSTHGEAAPADTTPETPDSATDSSFSADEPQASTEPPEWFAAVRDAKDPTEALRLLAKNLPRDQIEKDEVMSGLIGQIGDRRARELAAKQQRDAAEAAKLEAARNNDLYTLGEMTQRELQAQLASQQAAQAAGPFMDGVVAFQKGLPGGRPERDFRQGVRPGQEPCRRRGRIPLVHRRQRDQARAQQARVCDSQVGAERDQRRRTCTRARIRHPWSRPRSDR